MSENSELEQNVLLFISLSKFVYCKQNECREMKFTTGHNLLKSLHYKQKIEV